jgi:hypothetical protein
MKKVDATEAAGIVQRMMDNLAAFIPPSGESAVFARLAIGQVEADCVLQLMDNAIGEPLLNAFEMAKTAGTTWQQFEALRVMITVETPKTLGGILVQNSGIQLCLAMESQLISAEVFVSRQDVDAVLNVVNAPFNDAEEIAADDMDQATYQALIGLNAALVNHLITTARPLPRMLNYQFAEVMPSLVIAYRLYADAGRADEIVQENKIIHPLFCPAVGKGLSQ